MTPAGAVSAGGAGLGMELNFGPLGIISSGAVRIFSDAAALRAKRARQLGPPTLCFIEPSKTATSCVNVIERHQSLWQEWMANASQLLIIGARVAKADAHIWDPASAALRREVDYRYVSGKAAEEFGAWCVSNGRPPVAELRVWHWEEAFEETCTFLGV